MRVEEFEAEKLWWGDEEDRFQGRKESKQAWRIGVESLRARNFNLDIKNPYISDLAVHDPEVLLAEYKALQVEIMMLRDKLKGALSETLSSGDSL